MFLVSTVRDRACSTVPDPVKSMVPGLEREAFDETIAVRSGAVRMRRKTQEKAEKKAVEVKETPRGRDDGVRQESKDASEAEQSTNQKMTTSAFSAL